VQFHTAYFTVLCAFQLFFSNLNKHIFGQFFLQVISIISKGSLIQHFLSYMQTERQIGFSSCFIRM